MSEKNHSLEPDEMLPQESETSNTNEQSSPTDRAEEQGDVIGSRWWTWHEDASQWDQEIRHINKMQQKLAPWMRRRGRSEITSAGSFPATVGFPSPLMNCSTR